MQVVIFSLVLVAGVIGGDVAPHCSKPLDMGKPCKGDKPSIKYHFDAATMTCLAFEYTGCGGNENRFDSDSQCWKECLPIDHINCPAGSKPLKKPESCTNQIDKECGSSGYCNFGSHTGICCDSKIRDKVDKDYNPKCPKGKKVMKTIDGGIPTTRLGKNCKSKHCPKDAKCIEGTYFATCCI